MPDRQLELNDFKNDIMVLPYQAFLHTKCRSCTMIVCTRHHDVRGRIMSAISAIVRSASAAFLVAGLFSAETAFAQSGGCALERVVGTSRQILRCADGVTVTAEGGARFNLTDRNGDGRPDAVSLRSKAVLVDVDSARRSGGFQVVTPQAIAAVRGTRWAVDVKNGTTSVFVVRGRVAVQRPSSRQGVVLSVGEGVDVGRGNGSLTVRRWPQARAAALLARLGQ
jgi:ferric-dicitrate binding protein FerR (iron transport regulator)